ncbi:uncharacterized protein LOC105847989 [Hydra vulgaris]|uniref:uncharacterized protein LOC105847989 n=1 Tax=Hydra vulgaris TaxID=6087 RepID=UPI00064109D8|nr:uncharacterized protein LOC105847989 [Hydra vulgaris]
MSLPLCILLYLLIPCVISTQRQENKKKYVIEVQDHQLAMRAANPIVDLEDSVRRGGNDPFANPSFVINRINDDLLSTSLNLGLGNRELLAYHDTNYHINSGFHSPQILPSRRLLSPHIGTTISFSNSFKPAGDSIQNAVKEELVARQPLLFKANHPFKTFINSNIPFHQVSSINLENEEILHNQETFEKNLNIGVSGGEVGYARQFGNTAANMKSQVVSTKANANELPSYVPLVNRRIPTIRRPLDLHMKKINLSLGGRNFHNAFKIKPETISSFALSNNIENSNLNINNNNNNVASQRLNYEKRIHAVNIPQTKSRINPLTGLPEDLEERSYGLISSVTSVTDSTAPLSKTNNRNLNEYDDANSNIEVNAEVPQRRVAQKLIGPELNDYHDSPRTMEKDSSSLIENETPSVLEKEPSNLIEKETLSRDMPEEQSSDYNLASLKSFLEEDSILRNKLNKDGLESINMKKDSSYNLDGSIEENQDKLPNLKRTVMSKKGSIKHKLRQKKTS